MPLGNSIRAKAAERRPIDGGAGFRCRSDSLSHTEHTQQKCERKTHACHGFSPLAASLHEAVPIPGLYAHLVRIRDLTQRGRSRADSDMVPTSKTEFAGPRAGGG